MAKLGEVREILGRLDSRSVSQHGLHGATLKEYAKEICQKFPKSPDNPDGQESK